MALHNSTSIILCGRCLSTFLTVLSPCKSSTFQPGFVGSPWTLATYIIEGASSSLYKTIKSMAYSNPELLHALLSHLADAMSDYIKYQIDSGAQCVQIFDSWGGQLPPQQWDK